MRTLLGADSYVTVCAVGERAEVVRRPRMQPLRALRNMSSSLQGLLWAATHSGAATDMYMFGVCCLYASHNAVQAN